MHFAYLDEFGHIGPYVSRDHVRFNTSPVFGLAGLILPASEVREFSTWFYQRKCQLLSFEFAYPELTRFANRFFNRIERCGGKIVYVGIRKTADVDDHDSQALYRAVLRETIKRLDQYCDADCLGAC